MVFKHPILELAFSEDKTKPFIISHQILTYGKTQEIILKLTSFFEQKNFKKGHLVLLTIEDDLTLIPIFISLLANGYIPVIFDPHAGAQETKQLLNTVHIQGIIADECWLEMWEDTIKVKDYDVLLKIDNAHEKPLLKKLLFKETTSASSIERYSEVLEQIPTRCASTSNFDPELIAYILFTSGTTAIVPKGIEVTHRALFANLQTLKKHLHYSSTLKLLNLMPTYHADGLLHGPIMAYFCGGTCYKPCQFTVQNIPIIHETLLREKITHWICPPTMIHLFCKYTNKHVNPFSNHFKAVVSTAGNLEKSAWQNFEAQFKTNIVNLYGLTETVVVALLSGPDGATKKIGSLGKPVDSFARVVDEGGEDVLRGELLLKSDALFHGYHQQPELTQKVLRDGWFYTGDLVSVDSDGFFYFMGRKKSLIVSGGRSIVPEEITTCLQDHPEVMEATTFGIPDPEWEEIVVSAVGRHSPKLTEQVLIDYCRKELSSYKVPQKILILPNLPRKATGKIQYERLRALYFDEKNQRQFLSPTLSEQVLGIASSVFRQPVERLSLLSHSANTAGWDSLAHLKFITSVEKHFSVKFSMQDFMSVRSLKDVISTLERHFSFDS